MPQSPPRRRRRNADGLPEERRNDETSGSSPLPKTGEIYFGTSGEIYLGIDIYEDINRFTAGVLAEHLNFHRPCWFPRETTDRKGRVIRQYRPQDLRTPYEKFRSLPDAASFLREGVTLEQLELQACRLSDNESAERLLRERKKLFKPILAHLASVA